MMRTRSQSIGKVPRIYIHQFRRGDYDVNTIQYTKGSNIKPKDPLSDFTSDQFLPVESRNAAKKMKRRKKRSVASSKLSVSAFDKPKSGRKFAEAFNITSSSDLMTKVTNVSCSQSLSKRACPDLNGVSYDAAHSNIKNKAACQVDAEENHTYLKRKKLKGKRAEKDKNVKNVKKTPSKNISGGDIPTEEMLRIIQLRKATENMSSGEKEKKCSSIDEVIEEVIANFNTDVTIKGECSDARRRSSRGMHSLSTKSPKKQKTRNNRCERVSDERLNTGNGVIAAKKHNNVVKSSAPLICHSRRLSSKESLNQKHQNKTKTKHPKKKNKEKVNESEIIINKKKEIITKAARNEDLHSEKSPRKDYQKQTLQEKAPRVRFINENMKRNENVSSTDTNMHLISTKKVICDRRDKSEELLRQEIRKKKSNKDDIRKKNNRIMKR